MTVVSNITVYCIAWIVLGQGSEQSVGPQDEDKFRTIMFAVLGLGACTSLGFHLTVTEEEAEVIILLLPFDPPPSLRSSCFL